PLKVYLNEPLPWVLPPWPNATLAQLTADFPVKYSNIMVGTYYHDTKTFTEVYRHQNVDIHDDCFDTMLHLPGAPIYGIDLQRTICTIVQAPTAAVANCQNNILAGKLMGFTCIWTTYDIQTANLTFYFATMPVYDMRLIWFKFVYRVLLTVYVVLQLWRQYYRHYWSLFNDLRRVGSLDNEFCSIHRYQVYVGDPTSVMLSDPLLSAAFQVDIFLSTSEMIGASLRTLQRDDMTRWIFAILYCMRMIWFVFCGMRYGTFAIKRLRWEHRVAPLDTTLTTIATLVIANIFSILVGTTRVLYFHLWSNTIASSDASAIELVPAAILTATITMSSSVFASMGLAYGKKAYRILGILNIFTLVSVGRYTRSATFRHLSIKQRVLFRCFRSRAQVRRGGSIYQLHKHHPRSRRLPLVALESADCFMDCYDAKGRIVVQLRLSLLSIGLDLSEHAKVEVDSTESAFCTIVSHDTLSSVFHIRQGANQSPWLL
ncbi:hypothetical protein ACHHYP_01738, partial [Achlya hypogyna]